MTINPKPTPSQASKAPAPTMPSPSTFGASHNTGRGRQIRLEELEPESQDLQKRRRPRRHNPVTHFFAFALPLIAFPGSYVFMTTLWAAPPTGVNVVGMGSSGGVDFVPVSMPVGFSVDGTGRGGGMSVLTGSPEAVSTVLDATSTFTSSTSIFTSSTSTPTPTTNTTHTPPAAQPGARSPSVLVSIVPAGLSASVSFFCMGMTITCGYVHAVHLFFCSASAAYMFVLLALAWSGSGILSAPLVSEPTAHPFYLFLALLFTQAALHNLLLESHVLPSSTGPGPDEYFTLLEVEDLGSFGRFNAWVWGRFVEDLCCCQWEGPEVLSQSLRNETERRAGVGRGMGGGSGSGTGTRTGTGSGTGMQTQAALVDLDDCDLNLGAYEAQCVESASMGVNSKNTEALNALLAGYTLLGYNGEESMAFAVRRLDDLKQRNARARAERAG